MNNAFFKPFVGTNYHTGIMGKKILVLGASFYCPNTECPYFSKCTSTSLKDSSPYDRICPEYSANGISLHDEPTNSIDNECSTYVNFAKGMARFMGTNDYSLIWNRMAFTNYVQFFLPGNGENFRPTNASDLSERDFKAFIEVVKTLKPDVVIIWGCVINSRLKENNEYVIDKQLLPQTNWYLCHMKVPGIDHEIPLINPNHPSSTAWHSEYETFSKYLCKELGLLIL